MLEIEKIQKRFQSDSLVDMMKEYDRDFLKSPTKEEIPPNPQPQRSDDLFAQGDVQKKAKKDSVRERETHWR